MSEKYKEFIRTFPCEIHDLSCEGDVIPHHARMKGSAGMGEKPPDCYCIPLCVKHHREIHNKGVLTFFNKYYNFITKETLDEYLYRTLFKYVSMFCGEIERP